MFKDDLGLARPTPDPSPSPAARSRGGLPWIQVAPGAPYFVTEAGEPWTPVGQNDAISWIEFRGLFRRQDLAAVEAHLRWLQAHGVTCLRLMLEYAQFKHRYLEQPAGRYVPAMLTLWDDLFAMCERVGMRILLTPFDTFWMWLRWDWHPYNVRNGGPLRHPSEILLCGATRKAIKARLTFAVERWGGSGALFAWDLWNEIHPAQAGGSADCFGEFIHDLSQHVRKLERGLYGLVRLGSDGWRAVSNEVLDREGHGAGSLALSPRSTQGEPACLNSSDPSASEWLCWCSRQVCSPEVCTQSVRNRLNARELVRTLRALPRTVATTRNQREKGGGRA